jgi:hypothetical protein
MSKLMRFLKSLRLCKRGQRRILKYEGMTLQQAWKKASASDLEGLLFSVEERHKYSGVCWCNGDPRRVFKSPSPRVMRLYERANRRFVQSR